MVDQLLVIFQTLNVVVLIGLLVYAFKMRDIFGGGKVGASMPYFIAATALFLLSALMALMISIGVLTVDYNSYVPGVRFVAFIVLFVFAAKYVHDWRSM